MGPEKTSPDISPGDAEFVERGAHATISKADVSPGEFLVVTLKRHWDTDIRRCTEPKRCTHSIRAGGLAIGQSRSLFGNGVITAYSHQLDRGGTLASSYFSSTGQAHLLLVALTDLQASFDGQDENFKAGQVYATDAGQVEVNAERTQARWVVHPHANSEALRIVHQKPSIGESKPRPALENGTNVGHPKVCRVSPKDSHQTVITTLDRRIPLSAVRIGMPSTCAVATMTAIGGNARVSAGQPGCPGSCSPGDR